MCNINHTLLHLLTIGDTPNNELLSTEDFVVVTDNGQPVIEGSRVNNLVIGYAGNDEIFGRAGNDILLGNEGHDTLRGGVGKDILVGGTGNNRLLGGEDSDIAIIYDMADTLSVSRFNTTSTMLVLKDAAGNENRVDSIEKIMVKSGPDTWLVYESATLLSALGNSTTPVALGSLAASSAFTVGHHGVELELVEGQQNTGLNIDDFMALYDPQGNVVSYKIVSKDYELRDGLIHRISPAAYDERGAIIDRLEAQSGFVQTTDGVDIEYNQEQILIETTDASGNTVCICIDVRMLDAQTFGTSVIPNDPNVATIEMGLARGGNPEQAGWTEETNTTRHVAYVSDSTKDVSVLTEGLWNHWNANPGRALPDDVKTPTGAIQQYTTFVSTGEGNDRVYMNTEMNLIFTQGGNDYVQADIGSFGGPRSSDIVDGGAGDDYIYGGVDQDVLFGGAGNDELDGGRYSDILKGGTGNDTLSGEEWTDYLFGDAGNDYLEAGVGSDFSFGGDGNDIIVSVSDGGEPISYEAVHGQAKYGANNPFFSLLNPTTGTRLTFERASDGVTNNLGHTQGVFSEDHLWGGAGSDTFRMEFLVAATGPTVALFTDRTTGLIDWDAIGKLNSKNHEHWMESIGNDIIHDFQKGIDKIDVFGHTVVYGIRYFNKQGQQIGSYDIINDRTVFNSGFNASNVDYSLLNFRSNHVGMKNYHNQLDAAGDSHAGGDHGASDTHGHGYIPTLRELYQKQGLGTLVSQEGVLFHQDNNVFNAHHGDDLGSLKVQGTVITPTDINWDWTPTKGATNFNSEYYYYDELISLSFTGWLQGLRDSTTTPNDNIRSNGSIAGLDNLTTASAEFFNGKLAGSTKLTWLGSAQDDLFASFSSVSTAPAGFNKALYGNLNGDKYFTALNKEVAFYFGFEGNDAFYFDTPFVDGNFVRAPRVSFMGGEGNDYFHINWGNFRLPTPAGNDDQAFINAIGEEGNDRIEAVSGRIRALGGEGNDTIVNYADTYAHAILGGTGADTFVFDYRNGLKFDSHYIGDFNHLEGDRLILQGFDKARYTADTKLTTQNGVDYLSVQLIDKTDRSVDSTFTIYGELPAENVFEQGFLQVL